MWWSDAHEGAGFGGGSLVKDLVGVDTVALGVDVGGDTGNGGGDREDGGELHFDGVSKEQFDQLLSARE